MSTVALSLGRTATRRRRLLLAASCGTVAIGAAGATAYYHVASSTGDHAFVGLQRQASFWVRLAPVMFDYYWRFAASSPYVRFQERFGGGGAAKGTPDGRAEQLQACHERHAPEILRVMLDLKGLFVKLGQVLSVTALPLPEPYRVRFRTLQDSVPGHEAFGTVRAVLERELGRPVEEVFDSLDEVPCGAASIGQAHRGTLKETGEQVIVKVQYPDASWKVPADIQCVGDFMKACVWFGILDKDAAQLSFDEFSRQFLSELDYVAEKSNLQTVYQSTQDPKSPYAKRRIVVPRVLEELCSSNVITMTYLPGSKLEEEARRQLAALGIDTKKGIRDIVRKTADEAIDPNGREQGVGDAVMETRSMSKKSPMLRVSRLLGSAVGMDTIFAAVRLARRVILWSTAMAVSVIQHSPVVPESWSVWAHEHRLAAQQAEQLSLTVSWIDGLFDVHGHQIFQLGLFNADPHPGNILVLDKDYSTTSRKRPVRSLGLIDFGQCKRLTVDERVRIAKLILSVANNEPDDQVAGALRALNIQTKNDSTQFLAQFGRLMFGPFRAEHMDHDWHRRLHETDKVLYFPNELAMVYRTSLLLRGLAVSLQVNPSVAQQWRHHAEAIIRKHS